MLLHGNRYACLSSSSQHHYIVTQCMYNMHLFIDLSAHYVEVTGRERGRQTSIGPTSSTCTGELHSVQLGPAAHFPL